MKNNSTTATASAIIVAATLTTSAQNLGLDLQLSAQTDSYPVSYSYSTTCAGVVLMPAVSAAAETATPETPLEIEFNERAERWERETAVYSAPGPKILHADYQKIIGKGKPMIPFILSRMPVSGSNWAWALEYIADDNPAKNAKSYRAAVMAWTEWGKRHNYIS